MQRYLQCPNPECEFYEVEVLTDEGACGECETPFEEEGPFADTG